MPLLRSCRIVQYGRNESAYQTSRGFEIPTTISHSNTREHSVVHITRYFYEWAVYGQRFPTGC